MVYIAICIVIGTLLLVGIDIPVIGSLRITSCIYKKFLLINRISYYALCFHQLSNYINPIVETWWIGTYALILTESLVDSLILTEVFLIFDVGYRYLLVRCELPPGKISTICACGYILFEYLLVIFRAVTFISCIVDRVMARGISQQVELEMIFNISKLTGGNFSTQPQLSCVSRKQKFVVPWVS